MLQQDQEINLLRRTSSVPPLHPRVSFRFVPWRASGRCRVGRYFGVDRGREKDVVCRENVGVRETFRAKCPLVHLSLPACPRHGRANEGDVRDVQVSFVGNNGTRAAWGALIPRHGSWEVLHLARNARNASLNPIFIYKRGEGESQFVRVSSLHGGV